MPENEIYKFLKENNLTTKSEAEFSREYSSPEKSQELYNFFRENNLTNKDSASFRDTYFSIPTVSLTEEEATSGLQTEPEGVSTLKDTYKKGAELNSRVLLGTYDQRPQKEVFELQETLRPEYKQERKFTEQQLKDIAIQTSFSYPERLRNSFIQGLSPFISEASRNIGIMAKKI